MLHEKAEKPTRARLRSFSVQQWSIGIALSWTDSGIKNAQRQLRMGQPCQAAKLAESMLGDDEFPNSMARAIAEITGAAFTLAPETGPTGKPIGKSEAIAEKLGKAWDRALPPNVLSRLISWRLRCGIAIATIDWVGWEPRVRVLDPQYSWYDENRGAWIYSAKSGEHVITPGDGKWIFLGGLEETSSSAVCALGLDFYIKQCAWRDAQRYNERHGLPIIKAEVPVLAPEGERQAFVEDLSIIGTDTTVTTPTGMGQDGKLRFDVSLVEAQDQAFQTFFETLSRVDRKFQVYLVGSNASSELAGDVGSRAAAQSSESVARTLAASRAKIIAQELREQFLTPWALLTIPGARAEHIPYPSWSITSSAAEAKSAAWKATAEAIEAWGKAKYKVLNAVDLAGEMGLVIEEMPEAPMGPDGLPLPIGPDGKPLPPDETDPEKDDDSSNPEDDDEPAKNGKPAESLSAFSAISFADILSRYPRVAIVGGANTGKSTLSASVADRPVIHSDDFIVEGDYRASANGTLSAASGQASYVVEGVTAALAMRYGLQVDAVVHLTRTKAKLTAKQRSSNKGTETAIRNWRSGAGPVPVFGERGNGFARKP
jgi:hypothetical protein